MKCDLMRLSLLLRSTQIERLSFLPLGPQVPHADVGMEEGENPPPAMDLDLPNMDELFGNDDDQEMEGQDDPTEMAWDWLE